MTNPLHLSRRAALGLLTASVGAIAAAPGAYAARGVKPATTTTSALSRPDRVFLNRGLMHGAWVRSGSTDGWFPDATLWQQSGFTTPTFYNSPLWSSEVMDPLPGSTWAIAKAPNATQLSGTVLPPPSDEWLTTDQLNHVETLFTACFGDEEAYSDSNVTWLSQCFSATHSRHPDVLLHTNQAVGQFSDTQMRTYVQSAQPDLITFDNYYWQYATQYAGGSVTTLYNNIGRYRRLALEGLDGTGAVPIAFGQYTDGFRLIPAGGPATVREYFVSESQQNVVSYVTWAIGGRWLDLFRWEKGPTTASNTTDGQFLNYPDGSPTPQFSRYQDLNIAMSAYSPYLTRLRTRTASILRGINGATGMPVTQPAELRAYTSSTDPGAGVIGLSPVNTGTVNNGYPGDVLCGSFRQLPNMSAAEAGSWLPNPADTRAFMLVNGLTAPNVDMYTADSTGGSSTDTQQTITVTVDPRLNGSRSSAATLYRVDKQSGNLTAVPLQTFGSTVQFTVTIGGGQGELYLWS